MLMVQVQAFRVETFCFKTDRQTPNFEGKKSRLYEKGYTYSLERGERNELLFSPFSDFHSRKNGITVGRIVGCIAKVLYLWRGNR